MNFGFRYYLCVVVVEKEARSQNHYLENVDAYSEVFVRSGMVAEDNRR